MHGSIGITGPTGELGQSSGGSHIRELVEVVFSLLYLQVFEMYRPLVYTHGCTCLHTRRSDTVSRDTFSKMLYGWFGNPSACHHLPSDMHQSVEERSGCNHNSPRTQLHAPYRLHTNNPLCVLRLSSNSRLLHQQLFCLVLPDIEVGGLIQSSAPFPDKLTTVALGTGTPHGRSLASVQHTELDGCGIRHQTHLSTQGVYLADNLSFRNTAHGWVARHLCYLVHVHGDQTGLCSHVGCSTGCLAAGMATTDYQYVVVQNHCLSRFFLFNTLGRPVCG